jgi:DNA-binding transcriptional LysR family regulator
VGELHRIRKTRSGIEPLRRGGAEYWLPKGTLTEISLPGWSMTSDTIYAVYPETIALPLRVRAMIDYIASRLRPPLPWE